MQKPAPASRRISIIVSCLWFYVERATIDLRRAGGCESTRFPLRQPRFRTPLGCIVASQGCPDVGTVVLLDGGVPRVRARRDSECELNSRWRCVGLWGLPSKDSPEGVGGSTNGGCVQARLLARLNCTRERRRSGRRACRWRRPTSSRTTGCQLALLEAPTPSGRVRVRIEGSPAFLSKPGASLTIHESAPPCLLCCSLRPDRSCGDTRARL